MTPQFTLSTSRLNLRLIEPQEAASFSFCVKQSSSLHQWIDWCHPDFSNKESEQFLSATKLNWIKGKAYGFGLYRHCDNELIGMVAINELYHTFNMASIGYWVADKHQRNGYAKEATEALIDFCFHTLKVTRIEVVCDPRNVASHSIAISCGAQIESLCRNRFIFAGEPREGLVLSIIPN